MEKNEKIDRLIDQSIRKKVTEKSVKFKVFFVPVDGGKRSSYSRRSSCLWGPGRNGGYSSTSLLTSVSRTVRVVVDSGEGSRGCGGRRSRWGGYISTSRLMSVSVTVRVVVVGGGSEPGGGLFRGNWGGYTSMSRLTSVSVTVRVVVTSGAGGPDGRCRSTRFWRSMWIIDTRINFL